MILGIESSCDESALAIFSPERGLLGEWVHSQVVRHQAYGGVVPDLASREHLDNFFPLLKGVLKSEIQIDSIAITHGPGLAGCLALGLALGKSLALAWKVPLIGVNHLRGHAWSPFIKIHKQAPNTFQSNLDSLLPHIGLIASGGNTMVFEIDRDRHLRVLAETVDDAAGEALDKGAKLLGMAYPGGPLIEKCALEGDPTAFNFPRAFPSQVEFKFSFSGLKTSLRYLLEKMDDTRLKNCLPDLCASYQEAVVDQLATKTAHILKRNEVKSLGLSGGVANNKRLSDAFKRLADSVSVPLLIAEPQHTGDNAAMISFAAWADSEGSASLEPPWALSFEPALKL